MFINSIKKRSSVRTYKKEEINSQTWNKIRAIISRDVETPFKTKSRFDLISIEEDIKNLKGVGTYGNIKNPSAYIVGIMNSSNGYSVDFGYALEKIVLEITHLGLGTCWLGGTFTKSSFRKKVMAQVDEIVPCVISVGPISKEVKVHDWLLRKVAKSDERKKFTELFYRDCFDIPLTEIEPNLKLALEMVRLAPSASNRQPWRVVVKDKEFHFYIKRNPSYAKMLSRLNLSDLQMIDMGIAMCHFEFALEEKGIKGKWIKPNLDEDKNFISIFKLS